MTRGFVPCILRDEFPTLDEPTLEAFTLGVFTLGASGLRDVALTRGPVVRTGRAVTSLRVRTPELALCVDGAAAVRTVWREDVGRDDEYERLRTPVELVEPLYDRLGALLYDLDELVDGELYERLDEPPL